MKKINSNTLVAMIAFMFILAPQTSSAELSSNLIANINSQTDVSSEGSLELNNLLGGTKTNLNTDASVNVGVDLENKNDIKDDETSNTNESQAQNNSYLSVNSDGVAITSSSQVKSESDLDVFSSNISKKNSEVSKVETDSNTNGESEVEVIYKHKGKLFGFIPVTVKSKTVVDIKDDAKTEVHSTMSWWNFMVTGVDYEKNNIESRIKNNSKVQANAQINASAQAKAEIAEAIVAELNNETNVSGNASINN